MLVPSEEKLFNLVLHLVDLALELAVRVVQDDCRDDVSADAAGAAEVRLLGHVYVGNVLVLAEKREVEHNLEGLCVSCQDHEVGDTAVQRFRGLVGALLELAVKRGLVAQVKDLLGHAVVSLGPGAALGGLLLGGDDLLLGLLDLLLLL